MPCTPISRRRSFTSSNLNGLMMASIFFMRMAPTLPPRCFASVSEPLNVSNLALLSAHAQRADDLAHVGHALRGERGIEVAHDARGGVGIDEALRADLHRRG